MSASLNHYNELFPVLFSLGDLIITHFREQVKHRMFILENFGEIYKLELLILVNIFYTLEVYRNELGILEQIYGTLREKRKDADGRSTGDWPVVRQSERVESGSGAWYGGNKQVGGVFRGSPGVFRRHGGRKRKKPRPGWGRAVEGRNNAVGSVQASF